MTAALINVPKKAKNGDVIEIKTLGIPCDGNRLSPHHIGQHRPAQYHYELHLPL